MANLKQTKQTIQLLINKYEQAKQSNKLKSYTEEETKKDFILPLFEALGWDTSNKNEVSAEEHILSTGRVDYGFYLDGRAKFYMEAKKICADLHNPAFADQSVRYAWNKGVTWAILTDFESIKVFNAQDINKSLADKLFFEISYDKYLERFDQLWLLSKNAFTQNLLDKEGEKYGKKLQKISVSALLYQDLQKCRDILIKSLSIWNKEIDKDLLDEGVQKLLDRLIFIRVAEDRGIEPSTLIPLIRAWEPSKGKITLFASMTEKFHELNKTYNSNLFQPHAFEKWDEYDGSTKDVIQILYGKPGYYEYDFAVMPADVLGTVYENYLGHKLAKSRKGITTARDAKKRKEQGIYYTPAYIVDYIVENTLGPVLDNCKSIADLKRIKVLDPACGSGSFLVKALELIVNKYKEFGAQSNTYARIQIIIENLYGVDLDEQAVEIAQLNLLINALNSQIKLPFLTQNIKNGNSLISGPTKELTKYFGKNYRDKKPFNWEEEFPEVFKQGGFDVVIGNPPYVNLANIKDANEREYYKQIFRTAKNKSDLYSFFTEKAIRLLKNNGMLGFIFSNSWLGTDSFSKFREFLIENTTITKLVKLPSAIFAGATVTTVLMFLRKEKASEDHMIDLEEYINNQFTRLPSGLSYTRIKKSPGFSFSFAEDISFEAPTIRLGEIAKFSLGIKTSDDKRFISDTQKDQDYYKLLRGKDVGKYKYLFADKWIWYKPDLMIEKVGAGPRKLEYFLTDKILIKDVAKDIIATYDDQKYLSTDTLSIIYKTKRYDLKFILGLLNSTLVNRWFKTHFPAGLHIKINQMKHIPIPKVSKEEQKELIKLVDSILQLQKKMTEAKDNSNKWRSLKSEIEQTNKKIDEVVCRLYGLTKEEFKIVGGVNDDYKK